MSNFDCCPQKFRSAQVCLITVVLVHCLVSVIMLVYVTNQADELTTLQEKVQRLEQYHNRQFGMKNSRGNIRVRRHTLEVLDEPVKETNPLTKSDPEPEVRRSYSQNDTKTPGLKDLYNYMAADRQTDPEPEVRRSYSQNDTKTPGLKDLYNYMAADRPPIRPLRIRHSKGRQIKKKKSSRCIVGSCHFIPYYPKKGSLWKASDLGYLDDDIYRYWTHRGGTCRLTKTPSEPAFLGARQIKHKGYYLIYAQITFFDKGSVGFNIYQSDIRLATCAETIPQSPNISKIETCAISTVAELQKGDRLLLKPLYPGLDFSMKPSNTFWGIVKLK